MTDPASFPGTRLGRSYWPADTSRPLLDWTLGQALRSAAAGCPDRCALVQGGHDPAKRRRWSYSELLTEAEQTAVALLSRFSPGERIAVWAPNVPEWELLLYGCALAGIILVTVNPAYKARELQYVLGKSGASALFTVDEYRGLDTLAVAQSVRPALRNLRDVFRISEFGDFISGSARTANLPKVAPLDPCVIMFTSGTTGAQKGVVFHHRGIVNVTNFTQERGGLKLGGVFVNPMPMFHIGSLGHAGVGAVVRQSTHVLISEWQPTLFMSITESERGTYSLLVPTMIDAILTSEERHRYDISTLKNIVSGAAVVEATLIQRTKAELGSSICNIYGQTEMQGVISGTRLDDLPEDQAQTIGQPMPHVEVKIGDLASGEILPLNSPGEICVRGYQTMIGYFDMPEETAKTLRSDGWLHSGDLGSMDDRGYLKITGRIRDMITRGGENIYPREIENLLLEHPKISAVAVVGVPDARWGEQVAAVIIPAVPKVELSPAELHAFCRENLAAFKTPKYWCFVSAFESTETGKLQKFKLVERIVAGDLKLETI